MKILVVLPRIPYPLEKGDKLRAYHQIRVLSKQHDIYLVALGEGQDTTAAEEHLTPFCKKIFFLQQKGLRRYWNTLIAFFKGLPLQCGYFYSKKNQQRIQQIIQEVNPDRIFCQLFRMAEYVKNVQVKKVLDYQDVFSKGMYRRYEKAPWYKKPFFKMEYRRICKYERTIFDWFDAKTIITAVDRDLIPHPRNGEIVVVPNGVDFEQFSYNGEEKCYDLIFSGNMGYAPNVDAAEYLAQEIFPILLCEFPQLQLVLAGATPSPRVLALRSEHVCVTGWVDDMSEWYAKSKIFIAPMRMGTGLQNKLLEAMSMQLPCVTSPLAAKPLGTASEEGAVLVCSTTSEYVDAVRRLLSENHYYKQISQSGNQFVHTHYDWNAAVEDLEMLLR